ncbi:MAG: exosortase C-terminal domain/associated protein EpsI [Candidatus Zixiibacteriota bacterium]
MKKQYLLSITLILLGGIIGNVLRFTEKKPDRIPDFSQIPLAYADYSGTEQVLPDFTYDILKADFTTVRDYKTSDGEKVEFFLAYFKSQKYGSQIHSPKHCLPGGGWRIEEIHPYLLQLADGQKKEVNRLIISIDGHKSLMLYWYETRSGEIRNEYGLKFDLVKNSLLVRPTDAAIIRVTVSAPEGNFEKATRRAVDFIQRFYPFVEKSLPF